MTEQELYEKIRSSAEEIEVPESLSPENMKKKLDAMVLEQNKSTQKVSHWRTGRKIVAAAAVMLVCTAGVGAVYQMGSKNLDKNMTDAACEEMAIECAAEDGAESSDTAGNSDVEGKKANAGKLYVVAKDYGEVYDVLQEKKEKESLFSSDLRIKGIDTIYEATEETTSAAETAVQATGTADAAVSSEESYSKTNLQTEGVDESDIIKTDGKYIYVVDEDAVKIVDIQNTKMEVISEISVSMESASDEVVEMYVDGDILNLIVEREETKLQQGTKESSTRESSAKNSKIAAEDVTVDVYVIDSNRSTELLTYDISDRENPKLLGSMSQDGYYKTSRKMDNIVYLFTQKELSLPNLTREEAVTGENVSDWIPVVNGSAIDAGCIYVPENGNDGLIISSVNVEEPDAVVDNTLIMNNYVNIYVSTGAIYLYGTDYSGSGVKTQIAKFSLEDGVIDAVGATSAAGEVYDTFAINDNQGKLRLLTTDWSGEEDQNQLFLFDEKLKLTGSLKGIAEGEEIYAARYIGDIVYFVTYRNTDPLFAVDLSDEKKPKILSELKITGFSEYLHFWGEDKLLGIGYETDPDSGTELGLKITMFDISDPAKLKVAGSCVIEDVDYSPALYNYKCVLADAEENLIGFATESYGKEQDLNYLLFAWEDGSFKELLTEGLKSDIAVEKYRGLYVGDIFYLANTDWITSYNKGDAYQKIESLEL